ncbi:MAG: hypothetical protein CMJ30_05940, partial [Phycisphaerae bacterium]|nr:hypothetical protein [Phycisphaerae bacterium]
AQDIGPAPSGKKKDQAPSIASVDESQFGCLDGNGVTCCLPSGECIEVDDPDDQQLPGDAKLICRDLGGEAISYMTDFADDATSFESCAMVDAWGGCSRIPCCLPDGNTVTITTAQCRGVGGELAQVFDGTCLESDWMRAFTIGECFDPQGGQCIAGGPYNYLECESLGGVFLGFPTYDQVEDRPEWFSPVESKVPFPSVGFYPGRQWIAAEYPASGTPCDSCVGGVEPQGNQPGTWVERRGVFEPFGGIPPLIEPETYTLHLPQWQPPVGYQVTRVRVKLEGGALIKQAGKTLDDVCGPVIMDIRTFLTMYDAPALNVSDDGFLNGLFMIDRWSDQEEAFIPTERLPGSSKSLPTYAPFFDVEYGAFDGGVNADELEPNLRSMVAIGIDLTSGNPANPDGVIEWDSELSGDFGLNLAEWLGAGSNPVSFAFGGATNVSGAASFQNMYRQYGNIMATVCFDYEPLPPTGPCACPEETDLYLRETNASVLALPKVDLRWSYVGPDSPTPSDLKDADNYELEQDTILQLTNDFESDVRLQVILANGDGAIAGVDEPGSADDFRAHPGWNQEVFDVRLTGNQPQVASFAAGGSWSTNGEDTPDNITFVPFTVLDEADSGPDADEAPGRPASDAHPFQPNPNPSNPFAGPYDRELRGFAYVIAVESTGSIPREINWNHLDGIATVINYADTAAWTYRPVGLRALNGNNGSVLQGAVAGANGLLKLDDEMYAKPACEAVFGFQSQGSGSFGSPGLGVMYETSLELVTVPVVGDFRASGSGQDPLEGAPSVEMQTRVWNENEIKFEEDISFQCWSQYSDHLMPEIYTSTLLETDMGKARICAANAGTNYLDANSAFGLAMPTFPLFTTRAHHMVYSAADNRPVTSAGVTGRHVGRLEARIRYAR